MLGFYVKPTNGVGQAEEEHRQMLALHLRNNILDRIEEISKDSFYLNRVMYLFLSEHFQRTLDCLDPELPYFEPNNILLNWRTAVLYFNEAMFH